MLPKTLLRNISHANYWIVNKGHRWSDTHVKDKCKWVKDVLYEHNTQGYPQFPISEVSTWRPNLFGGSSPKKQMYSLWCFERSHPQNTTGRLIWHNWYVCYVASNLDALRHCGRGRYFKVTSPCDITIPPGSEISAPSCDCVPASQHTTGTVSVSGQKARSRKNGPETSRGYCYFTKILLIKERESDRMFLFVSKTRACE